MSTKETREEWIKWLIESRNLSIEIIIESGLGIDVEGGELAIPVRDTEGTFLFNKYRRSPWNQNGPKYRYTAGSGAALFGAERLSFLSTDEDVVITEGELDALALRSLGQAAVSSTGGSGTWREEWSRLLDAHKPVICYDADMAGIEGAMKVAMTFPQGVKIAWIPPQYGKDPTDCLAFGQDGAQALGEAVQYAQTYKVPAPGTERRLSALSSLLKQLVAEKRETLQDREGTPFHRNFAIAWVEKQIKAEKDAETYQSRGPVSGDLANRLEQARAYPIGKLIKVDSRGFALCPFHEEKTGSFKVFKDNHGYCYGGCGKRFDSLDVYAKINNIDTQEKGAFKRITDALI